MGSTRVIIIGLTMIDSQVCVLPDKIFRANPENRVKSPPHCTAVV